MIKTTLTCDQCGRKINENYLAFTVEDTKHFFKMQLAACSLFKTFSTYSFIDLTTCAFCDKKCLIDYLEEMIDEKK